MHILIIQYLKAQRHIRITACKNKNANLHSNNSDFQVLYPEGTKTQ